MTELLACSVPSFFLSIFLNQIAFVVYFLLPKQAGQEEQNTEQAHLYNNVSLLTTTPYNTNEWEIMLLYTPICGGHLQ